MRAPPNTAAAASVTAYQLLEIIRGLKLRPPPDKELAVLVAMLAGMRYCNEPTEMLDEHGRFLRHAQRPPHLRPLFDAEARAIGHPRPRRGTARLTHRRPKKWQDFAPEIAARFRAMYPDQEFGDREGPLAGFVAAVVPSIFPKQKPSVRAVGLLLARRKKRTSRLIQSDCRV
jgi:hypothetical protein